MNRSRSLAICPSSSQGWQPDLAGAQSYATRPIRMLVPYPPGAATDISARILAARLSESLGQQVIVDNRPGASGMIATALLARAAPDGHTMMVVDVAHGANPALNEKMPYDTLKDLSAVSLVLRVPMLLLVNPAFPAQSVKELIAIAKANPGKFNYGSAGTGSTMYLIAELFKAQAGVDLVHVSYKGGAPGVGRRDGRPDFALFPVDRGVAAPRQGGTGAGARHFRPQPQPGRARDTDHRGERRAGLRVLPLAGHDRSRRSSATHHGAARTAK